MRSRSANLEKRGRPCGAASAVTAWPDPSSRRRDLAPGGWCPPPEPFDLSSLASGRRGGLVSGEWRAVDEHAVHHDRKLREHAKSWGDHAAAGSAAPSFAGRKPG